MSPKRKPIPSPLAVAERPARPLRASLVRGGLPTVAALLAACAALGCAEAPEGVRADGEQDHAVGLARAGKSTPPSPGGLPWLGGGGGEEKAPVTPAAHPPVVKGEAPAVKPTPVPTVVTPAVPGGMKAIAPVPSTTPTPPPIPPAHKSPKLGGDVAPVDPSI